VDWGEAVFTWVTQVLSYVADRLGVSPNADLAASKRGVMVSCVRFGGPLESAELFIGRKSPIDVSSLNLSI